MKTTDFNLTPYFLNSKKQISILVLFLISTLSVTTEAQQSDSTHVEILYRQIIAKTKCTNDFTSAYLYGLLYSNNSIYSRNYYYNTSSHTTTWSNNSNSSKKTTNTPDTVYIREQIVRVDTVLMYQDIANQEEVKSAQNILQTILEDGNLTILIQELVSNMSSEEVKNFRKEMLDEIQEMKEVLRQEQAQKLVLELEAKRLRYQLASEAAKNLKNKEKMEADSLTKDEKKALVKAKVALATNSALGNGKAGASLAVVGNIVVQGIVAIGKGIIAIGKGIANTAKAIWNWIDDHFYVRIDLSCAEQRNIKKHRTYVAAVNQHKHLVYYKGNCPQWQGN